MIVFVRLRFVSRVNDAGHHELMTEVDCAVVSYSQTGKPESTATAEFSTWITSTGPPPGKGRVTVESVTMGCLALAPLSRWSSSIEGPPLKKPGTLYMTRN